MMEKRLFYSVYLICWMACLLYTSSCFSQNEPATWQEQLNFLKTNLHKENWGDANDLNVINCTYKGVIGNETNKSRIIDAMLSPDAPAVLCLPTLIIRDTVTREDSCIITEVELPKFEIISIQQMAERTKSKGEENPLIQSRKSLNDLIKLDFEYLELEWDYKGKRFKSIGIVSDKQGGFVYDPIASNILLGESKIVNIREAPGRNRQKDDK